MKPDASPEPLGRKDLLCSQLKTLETMESGLLYTLIFSITKPGEEAGGIVFIRTFFVDVQSKTYQSIVTQRGALTYMVLDFSIGDYDVDIIPVEIMRTPGSEPEVRIRTSSKYDIRAIVDNLQESDFEEFAREISILKRLDEKERERLKDATAAARIRWNYLP